MLFVWYAKMKSSEKYNLPSITIVVWDTGLITYAIIIV